MTTGKPLVDREWTLTFTANLYVHVIASDEDEARVLATEIAEARRIEFANMTVQDVDWIHINSDDIVAVTSEELDPYDRYGTPEHEAWLIEMERQEG